MKGLAGAGVVLPVAGIPPFNFGNPECPSTDSGPELIFFKNEANEFAFLNVLGKAHYKFSDIGEVLAIRALIDENNPSSFVSAYIQFADACKKTADDSNRNGQHISARDAYARASTYYYAATDYLDAALQSDRFKELFLIHRACWKSAVQLMDCNYQEFSIPYEGGSLAGFFISHKGNETPRPLCIFNNGSDGSIVDAWTFGGAGIFERGYNLMTFDGPGQGSSLFEKNLYFRYDWEKVVTPVVDSVIHRKDVDKNKIVLVGISQGGYWVPRAAAYEKRIKVIIADPGVTDISSSWLNHLPPPLLSLLKSGQKDQFNTYLEQGFKQFPASVPVYAFRSRPYGKSNPFDVYTEVLKYKLDGVADKIECPVIIPSPENEQFWPGQSQALYDMVKSQKILIPFTAAEGGNYHCEPKARILWEQKVLDALDAIMKI
jgi:pimeloyl-ACP methyl ester carboxylesterase